MKIQDTTIVILGAGAMGGAIARGLIMGNTVSPDHLILTNISLDYLKDYQDMGCSVTTDNLQAVKKANIVILAVKPQIIKNVLSEIQDHFARDTLVLSIAAGISIQTIKSGLSPQQPVVRVMPNLNALVNESMSTWTASVEVSEEQKKIAQTLLQSIGKEVEVTDESLIDSVTAVAGSGPAYIFYLAELMEQTAVKMGFSPEQAHTLVTQTVVGSARTLATSHDNPSTLRKQVTSKGGTTEAALTHLQDNSFSGIFTTAIEKAQQRAKELNS